MPKSGVVGFVDKVLRRFTNEQSLMGLKQVFEAVYAALNQQVKDGEGKTPYISLMDIYRDDGGGLVAVVAQAAKLYRIPLTISKGDVTLGEWERVVIDFSPTNQSKMNVVKQSDGSYRWFAAPAATAVLNRSGTLDTRQLFDKLIEHAEKTGDYPFLSIYHQGKSINIGRCDFMMREGYALVESGTFETKGEMGKLAQAVARTLASDTAGYWGISIGFLTPEEKIDHMDVSGISIPVFTEGQQVELSILPEEEAACLFTGINVGYSKEVTRMKEKAKQALLKLAGDDPEALKIAEGLVVKLDAINDTAEADDLIRQATDEEEVEEEVVEEEYDEDGEEFELTEEAVSAIAEQVLSTEQMSLLPTSVTALQTKLTELQSAFDAYKKSSEEAIAGLVKRLKVVETDDDTRLQTIQEDKPRKTMTQVTYRPRAKTQADEEEEEEDDEASLFAETADETLGNLK